MNSIIKNIKNIKNSEDGFTMIEMMTALVIIGILTIIAVPLYLNHRQANYDFASQGEAQAVGKAVMSKTQFTKNRIPPTSLAAAGISQSSNGVKLVYKTDGKSFCIFASHEGGEKYTLETPYVLYNGLPENCPAHITALP